MRSPGRTEVDSMPKSLPPASRIQPMADAVRRRRRSLSMTQIDLSRFAGCGPDFIYDVESGKSTIRLDKLLDVLLVLGLELRLADGKRGLAVDEALRGAPETP
jgi:y4mF family transcriptional regulator